MSNRIADEGQVFVCMMCGKRSRDRYGNRRIDRGWDESCMLNAVLCYENKLVIENSRVVRVEKEGFVEQLPCKH